MIKAHSLEERAPREVIERQASLVRDSGSLNALLDANPSIVLVLNQFRQVVYANQVLARFLKLDELGYVFGMRPGEVLNCVNSDLNPGGCGNSEFCKTCGALKQSCPARKAILTSRNAALPARRQEMPWTCAFGSHRTPLQASASRSACRT